MNSSFNDFSNIWYRKDIIQNDYNVFINRIQRNRLSLLDLSAEIEIISNNRIKSYVQCLALESIEYRYLLSGTINGAIQLFDLCSRNSALKDTITTKTQIKPYLEYIDTDRSSMARLGMLSSIQWYPEDTGVFITSNMSGKISIFDTNTFTPVMNFSFSNSNQVYCTRIRPYNPDLIAIGLSDSTVRLCDPRTHDTSHVLNGHTRAVTCIEWNPQCTYQLISSDMNGAIHTWDVRKAGINAIIKSFDWREDFSINHDLNTKHHLRTVPSTTSLHRFAASRAHDSAVMSLSCTSCGCYLLSSGNDGKLRLWNMNTGQLFHDKYNNSEDLKTSSTSNSIVPFSKLPYTSIIAEFSSPSDDVIIIPRASNLKSPNNNNTSHHTNNMNEGDIMILPLHQPLQCYMKGDRHTSQLTSTTTPRILKGHLDRVTSMVYRKPYQQLITAAKDGMIFVWEDPQIKKKSSHPDEVQVCHNKVERYDYQQVLNRFSNYQSNYSKNKFNVNHSNNELENSYSSEDNWSDDDDDDDDGMEVNDFEQPQNNKNNNYINNNNNKNNINNNNKTNNNRRNNKKRSFVPPIIQKYLEDAKISLQRERQLSSLAVITSLPSTTTSQNRSNSNNESNINIETTANNNNNATTTWNNIDQIFTLNNNNNNNNNNMDSTAVFTSNEHHILNVLSNDNQLHLETTITSYVPLRHTNNTTTNNNKDNQYKNWIKRLKTKKK